MKLDNFAEIVETNTPPTDDQMDITRMNRYVDVAAYQNAEGSAVAGSYFFNTTENLIFYYNGVSWTRLGDHAYLYANKGTVAHDSLDTHYNNDGIHFEMLDEDDLLSNSPMKCPTQQSLKAYTQANQPTLNSYEYNETIAQGDLLKIINDSGAKVEKIVGVEGFNYGTAGEFYAHDWSSGVLVKCCYDSSNDKVIVFYDVQAALGGYEDLVVIVGTISGTSISFGTPTQVLSSGAASSLDCAFDSTNEKIVLAYKDPADNYIYAAVGTVSGTTISLGTAVALESITSYYPTLAFDSTNGKMVCSYRTNDGTNRLRSIVGTVSGTSISFGTPATIATTTVFVTASCYSSGEGKVVVIYKDGGNANFGTAAVGTVSGTSISFGTPVVYHSISISRMDVCEDPVSNKIVVAYNQDGGPDDGTVVVGTISGTSISFGTPVVFASSGLNSVSCAYHPPTSTVAIVYNDDGNGDYGTLVSGTVSGTSISFGTPEVFFSGANSYVSICYGSSSKQLAIAYDDGIGGNGNFDGDALVASYDTPEYFFGIAQEAGASGTSHDVAILYETSEIHSGATPGLKGYIQTDGTLGVQATKYPIGIFTSATEFDIYKDDQE